MGDDDIPSHLSKNVAIDDPEFVFRGLTNEETTKIHVAIVDLVAEVRDKADSTETRYLVLGNYGDRQKGWLLAARDLLEYFDPASIAFLLDDLDIGNERWENFYVKFLFTLSFVDHPVLVAEDNDGGHELELGEVSLRSTYIVKRNYEAASIDHDIEYEKYDAMMVKLFELMARNDRLFEWTDTETFARAVQTVATRAERDVHDSGSQTTTDVDGDTVREQNGSNEVGDVPSTWAVTRHFSDPTPSLRVEAMSFRKYVLESAASQELVEGQFDPPETVEGPLDPQDYFESPFEMHRQTIEEELDRTLERLGEDSNVAEQLSDDLETLATSVRDEIDSLVMSTLVTSFDSGGLLDRGESFDRVLRRMGTSYSRERRTITSEIDRVIDRLERDVAAFAEELETIEGVEDEEIEALGALQSVIIEELWAFGGKLHERMEHMVSEGPDILGDDTVFWRYLEEEGMFNYLPIPDSLSDSIIEYKRDSPQVRFSIRLRRESNELEYHIEAAIYIEDQGRQRNLSVMKDSDLSRLEELARELAIEFDHRYNRGESPEEALESAIASIGD